MDYNFDVCNFGITINKPFSMFSENSYDFYKSEAASATRADFQMANINNDEDVESFKVKCCA